MDTMDSCENVGPLDVSIKKENTHEDGTMAVRPKMDVDKYCGGQFNNNGQVVEALKARIRELELMSKTGGDKFTCLLCKVSETRAVPVVKTRLGRRFSNLALLQLIFFSRRSRSPSPDDITANDRR